VKITVSEFYARHMRKAFSGRTAMRDREKARLWRTKPLWAHLQKAHKFIALHL